MKSNELANTVLQAPYPLKKGFPLKPQVVFLASLSLYLASSQVAANPAVDLPGNPPGLDIEFRCVATPARLQPARLSAGERGRFLVECPLDQSDRIALGGPDNKYLQFDAIDQDCTSSESSPVVVNEQNRGIGVRCPVFEDSAVLNEVQELEITVRDIEGISTSTVMNGIYINNLPMGSFNGESCDPSTQGVVVVGYVDEQNVPQPDLTIPWTSDSADGGEGCLAGDRHAVFVGFEGTKQVTSILLDVTTLNGGEGPPQLGPVAAGLSVANVNPSCFEQGDGLCTIDLVGNPLPGQDMAVVIDDEDLFGSVTVVDGFPVRVLDPRASCQATPSGLPETLEFNGASIYTYYPPDATVPGDQITAALPLVVSDDGSTEYLILSEKGCGIPRMMFNSPAVARGTPGSMPYIDVIALESDIDPVDSLILFESSNEAPYECKPGPIPGPLPVGAALDQPLGEINSRDSEVKQLAGVPGIVDPMSRDKTQACGSRRIGSERFSFIGYSLIHNLLTDMRAELDDEIQVLSDTVTRAAACVDSSFYYGQLVAYPGYIRQYFDIGVDKVENDCDAAQGQFYFGATTTLVDRFTSRLETLGSTGFLRCYASGSNLDQIKAFPPMALVPGDKPLNTYGGIITQLQHLSYSLKTFENELIKLPASCP